MKYKVSLTHAALNDLYTINDYYLKQVSDSIATGMIKKLQKAVQGLENLPERGSLPNELTITGITLYWQIISSNYRIIYRVREKDVYVVMIIDGRRDVATALLRRLQVYT